MHDNSEGQMTIERKVRHQVSFEIVYDDGDGFMSGRVLDISQSGLFLETAMPLEAGTKVRMTPLVPEEVGLFEIEGEVMRTDEYTEERLMTHAPGMGIRFINMSDAEHAELEKLMERLEREQNKA